MKDENDPQPGLVLDAIIRQPKISAVPPVPADDFGTPIIVGTPGTVEQRIRMMVRWLVTALAQRLTTELQQAPSGRWPNMRKGMLLDLQQHLAVVTIPFIPMALRNEPLPDCGHPIEMILGHGDQRTFEQQLNDMIDDMRLLAVGLDKLDREDADDLARWLRKTANQLDPWGIP